jgi:hypothetical protein
LRNRALTPFGQKRFAAILNNMRLSGYITKTQWLSAITRGDFGRPIQGYAKLIAAETQNKLLCPGSPGCPDDGEEIDDDEADDEASEVSYPPASTPPALGVAPLETGTPGVPPASALEAPATSGGASATTPSVAPKQPTIIKSPGAVGAPSPLTPSATPAPHTAPATPTATPAAPVLPVAPAPTTESAMPQDPAAGEASDGP